MSVSARHTLLQKCLVSARCTKRLCGCFCSAMSDKSELKAELERKKQRLAQIREEKKRKEEERKKKEVRVCIQRTHEHTKRFRVFSALALVEIRCNPDHLGQPVCNS